MGYNTLDNFRTVCAEYQNNIRKSKQLRGDILKGVQQGREPLELLSLSCECISLMTGDNGFVRQIREDIGIVYYGDKAAGQHHSEFIRRNSRGER